MVATCWDSTARQEASQRICYGWSWKDRHQMQWCSALLEAAGLERTVKSSRATAAGSCWPIHFQATFLASKRWSSLRMLALLCRSWRISCPCIPRWTAVSMIVRALFWNRHPSVQSWRRSSCALTNSMPRDIVMHASARRWTILILRRGLPRSTRLSRSKSLNGSGATVSPSTLWTPTCSASTSSSMLGSTKPCSRSATQSTWTRSRRTSRPWKKQVHGRSRPLPSMLAVLSRRLIWSDLPPQSESFMYHILLPLQIQVWKAFVREFVFLAVHCYAGILQIQVFIISLNYLFYVSFVCFKLLRKNWLGM